MKFHVVIYKGCIQLKGKSSTGSMTIAFVEPRLALGVLSPFDCAEKVSFWLTLLGWEPSLSQNCIKVSEFKIMGDHLRGISINPRMHWCKAAHLVIICISFRLAPFLDLLNWTIFLLIHSIKSDVAPDLTQVPLLPMLILQVSCCQSTLR